MRTQENRYSSARVIEMDVKVSINVKNILLNSIAGLPVGVRMYN